MELLQCCTKSKSSNLQIVLKGAGRHFCAGIDVGSLAHLMVVNKDLGEGREQEKLRRDIKDMQVGAKIPVRLSPQIRASP